MPARNRIKQYKENGYYHIYNRGTEKRKIFLDKQDYNVFISYLKEYLLPRDENKLYQKLSNPKLSPKEKDEILRTIRRNNFSSEITLIAYCLMPNHFHFLIHQKNIGSMDKLMNSLGTRYTMYFNKKYDRVGSLYQSVYKAVLVNTDEQLLELSRYIHKQALPRHPSSYPSYLKNNNTIWVQSETILNYFSKTNPYLTYQSFMNQEIDSSLIRNLVIESN